MKLRRETTVAMPTNTQRACRKAGCERLGDHARGLCLQCYRATADYVARGVTTWPKLEAQGKVLKPKTTLKEWLLS